MTQSTPIKVTDYLTAKSWPLSWAQDVARGCRTPPEKTPYRSFVIRVGEQQFQFHISKGALVTVAGINDVKLFERDAGATLDAMKAAIDKLPAQEAEPPPIPLGSTCRPYNSGGRVSRTSRLR